MKRSEMEGLELEEIQERLTNEITEYEASLQTKSIEELKSEEEILMEKFKENDEYISSVNYKLDDEVTVELDPGTPVVYKAKEVMKFIVGFLNTIESEWKTSLGIFQLMRFFNKVENHKSIPYGTMDSILRILGSSVKYRGENDLTKIFVINNWLSGAHDEYAKDSIVMHYLSSLHQAVLNCMEKLQKETGEDAVE